jgi:thymidylate synthase ThyX
MTITAKIIADSIRSDRANGFTQPFGRITTYELEFPRFILPEFNTHRLFSRNAQSSRAVPVAKMIENIRENPAMPSHWGKAEPGMQAKEECNEYIIWEQGPHQYPRTRENMWLDLMAQSTDYAEALANAGYHKQIVNRLTEPYAHIKVVCTATEYDNFFWLRRHPDAQPEIRELANAMWEAMQASTPVPLGWCEWHVPYYKDGYFKPDGKSETSVSDAIMISSSCCAQVSYRKLDDSLEKAAKIYERLVESKPIHASPFEHQAYPLQTRQDAAFTHEDKRGNLWSGNFKWWGQYRQLLDGHTCWKYEN